MLIHVQAPATKDICIFCLARTQFSSVHAFRRPERRLLTSTRSLKRPPVSAVAVKDEDDGSQDAVSAWTAQPPRPLGGGWAKPRRGASSELTLEEEALVKELQKKSTPEPSVSKSKALQNGEPRHTQGLRTQRQGVGTRMPYAENAERQAQNSSTTRFPSRSAQQNGRLHQNVTPRAPTTGSKPESTEDVFNLSRPKYDGWAQLKRTSDLRQADRKETAPKPQLPSYQIGHSPRTSSEVKPKSNLPTNDTRWEEFKDTLPAQVSSPQRQHPNQNEFDLGTADYRRAGDAQVDDLISRSSRKSVLRRGEWYCPSCEQQNSAQQRECIRCKSERFSVRQDWECEKCGISNFPTRQSCRSCQTPASSTTRQHLRTPIDRKLMTAKSFDSSSMDTQPEKSLAQERLENTGTAAKAKAIEQIEREKMERLEQTKHGEFVGLRGQYDDAKYKAMSDSYWSSETSDSQLPDAELTTSNTPDNSISESSLGHRQAQSSENPQLRQEQVAGDQRAGQMVADQDQVTGLDFRTPIREIRSRREPQEGGIARQLVLEDSMPRASRSNRERLRKTKSHRVNYDDGDPEDIERAARRLERVEQRKKAKAAKKAMEPPTPIYLPEFITVANLAGVLRVRVEDFIYKMKELGFDETKNDHILDAETAGLVAAEFNFEAMFDQVENPDLLPRPPAEDKSVLPSRPPVVTIMGHVDHGKTTLLDYLRKSSVAASEHGGITQHIGAFSVPMPGGRVVTFLDTPGHEAFLSMRQRGANVTDMVILVVAADDSVKLQTVEAIRHAQAAKVPMIVAINKIDKEDSNAERVKQDLARYGVEIEDFGGDTQVVCVSGKTGQGMEELEDAAVALADILDMRSETDGQAEGWVLEATTKKAGRVATVLVRRGTLRPGDIIVAGTSWARVRSVRNEAGVMLESAGPGTPVEIDGWREQPTAGDEVLQAPDEQRAKAVIAYRLEAHERVQMATDMAAVNESRRLEQEKREEAERAAANAEKSPDNDSGASTASEEGHTTPSAPSHQDLFFIVKADVSGSVEAVTNAVSALGNSEVRPHILRSGVGTVTEFDINHAAVANGHIISFNTTISGNMRRLAETKKVDILDQSIIYRLVDDVKAKLGKMLPDVVTQKVLGEAEIAQVFDINIKGRVTVPVAGCKVRNGVIAKTSKVRVLRDKEVIYNGSQIPISFHLPT